MVGLDDDITFYFIFYYLKYTGHAGGQRRRTSRCSSCFSSVRLFSEFPIIMSTFLCFCQTKSVQAWFVIGFCYCSVASVWSVIKSIHWPYCTASTAVTSH